MSDYIRNETVAEEMLRRNVANRFDFVELVVVPAVAVLIALAIGGIIMLLTGVKPPAIGAAYAAMFTGSLGSLSALSETLTAAAPLIFAGLGVALAFRAGLFNIGAEGQFYLGAIFGVLAGTSLHGLPGIVEIPLALAFGMLGGFI